ncbi:MAG: hypothetical protein AAGA18_10025 [Verrucomicrobiota bacterium]
MSDFEYEHPIRRKRSSNQELEKKGLIRRKKKATQNTEVKKARPPRRLVASKGPPDLDKNAARLDVSKPGFKEHILKYANLYFGFIGFLLAVVALYYVVKEVKSSFKEDSIASLIGSKDKGEINEEAALPENEEAYVSSNGEKLFNLDLKGDEVAAQKASLALESSRVGLFDEAQVLIKEAREIDPNLYGLALVEATLFMDREEWADAEYALIDSIEKQQMAGLSYFRLAQVYRYFKKYDDALAAAMGALQRVPNNEFIMIMISDLHRFLGNEQEGVTWAKQAYELKRNDSTFEMKYYLSSIQAGVFDDVAYGLKYKLERDYDLTNTDLILGAAYSIKNGNQDQAIDYLSRLRARQMQEKFDSYMTDPTFAKIDF